MTDIPLNRSRANSDKSHTKPALETGPLNGVVSSDPDLIDGLHHSSNTSEDDSAQIEDASVSFLPTLEFQPLPDFGIGNLGSDLSPPVEAEETSQVPLDKPIYNHPNMNSSAPALSKVDNPIPPPMSQRSVTAPTRRVVFAENLSVYDTFSRLTYDRRGHVVDIPAALARVIREEINSYKMEEMIVHAASHTKYVTMPSR